VGCCWPGKLFKDVGLECDMKVVGSSSKTLSFRKPLQPTQAAEQPNRQSEPEAPSVAGELQAEALGTVPAS
jgi:hypothetical protein